MLIQGHALSSSLLGTFQRAAMRFSRPPTRDCAIKVSAKTDLPSTGKPERCKALKCKMAKNLDNLPYKPLSFRYNDKVLP